MVAILCCLIHPILSVSYLGNFPGANFLKQQQKLGVCVERTLQCRCVKSANCSGRGVKIGSQHPHGMAHVSM